MRDVLVLFSGGLDSTVCCEIARQSGVLWAPVHFRYGQPAGEMEMIHTGNYVRRHGIRRLLVDLPIIADAMRIGPGSPGPRVLPGRNLAMLAVAANIAAANKCREVWIGCNADDARDYPDCRRDFIASASSLMMSICGVSVAAPLIDETKAGVIRRAADLRIDVGSTWSCYEPAGDRPCGACNACRLRAVGGA